METSLRDKLLFVHPEIQKRRESASVVEDVMNRKVTPGLGVVSAKDNKYLPKGNLETDDDYARRLSMTPFFPETPHIVADRIGAIFADAPILDGSDKDEYADLKNVLTVDKKSLTDTASTLAQWIQRVGFCGVFVGAKKLDAQTAERARNNQVSQAEVIERKLDSPECVIYLPHQILDFEMENAALKWVKVVEYYSERKAWNESIERYATVRIIDAQAITSYRVSLDDENKEPEISSVVAHDLGTVPFVPFTSLLNSWAILGGTMLRESAEADVASTRMLSDIIWDLFILGNPILAWITHDESKKLLDANAGRYVKLKPGVGAREAEDLRFVVLDENGIRLLIDTHNSMKVLGRSLAGRVGDAVVQEQPTEVSGVSRAWQFKTGEERVLFLITNSLQAGFNKLFDLIAKFKKLEPENIKVIFSRKFDLTSPKDSVEVAEKVLGIVSGLNLPVTKKVALRKVVDSLGPVTSEEESAIDDELETLEMEAKSNADNPPNERRPDGRTQGDAPANPNGGGGSGNARDN